MPASGKFDVAIAGAGSFGAWIALTLARRRMRVCIADPYGPGNSRSSSGGETRIIRMSYGADELYTEMSLWSLAEWKQLNADLFVNCGALFTARPGWPHFEASFAALRRARVVHRRLTSESLRRRFPQIRHGRRNEGLFEPNSGVLLARRATEAALTAAVEAGAVYRRAAVDPVTFREQIDAERYVFACGAWLPKLFPRQLRRRIFPTRQNVLFYGVPAGERSFSPDAMPAWVDFESEVYALPDIENRGVKVALHKHGPRIDPDTAPRLVSPAAARGMSKIVARWLPALAQAPIVETRVCQYENSANGDFLIDELEPGIWVAGAGSGHGFKHGPAVGAYLAGRFDGSRAPEPRFALQSKSSVERRTVY